VSTQTQVTARVGRRQTVVGSRFLATGAILIAIGLIVVAVGGGFADFAGLGLAALGSVPAIVGVGLILAGAVARRSASDRYWA
jgi:hypothetical protein